VLFKQNVYYRYVGSDQYVVQPTEANQSLVIDRITRELNIVEGSRNMVAVLKRHRYAYF